MEAIERVVAAVTTAVARRAPHYVDIEDIAQEARIECWQSAAEWDPSRGAKLSTFLHTCGTRAALRWIRSEAHWRGVTEREYRSGIATPRVVHIEHDVPERAWGDRLAAETVSEVCVQEFLESLTPRQRFICEQRLRGLTSQEIAPLCGTRSSAVRRQLMCIRRRAEAWRKALRRAG